MTRSWITLALGALILLPSAATAQEDNVMVFSSSGRPRIGVLVDMDAPAANKKLGATVKSVTPDGPAAKAGLQAGDIITRFNGVSLANDSPNETAGQKLVELAQALSPGDTAKVDYLRGSTKKSASIVAADLGGNTFVFRGGPGGEQMVELAPLMRERARAMADRELAFVDMERAMDGMGSNFSVRVGGGPGLDLAEMNAGLGEYFGTSKGVLVLENPADSTMPLKAGDVIVAIDGREPASIGQARRILSSYDSGDVAKFEIMRMKKKTTVTWTVPARRGMMSPKGMKWRSGSGPMPPAAPAPKVRVRAAPTGRTVPAAPAAPARTVAPPAAPAAQT